MTCFRVGQFGTSCTPSFEEGGKGGGGASRRESSSARGALAFNKPLVDFSIGQDRAHLLGPQSLLTAHSSRRRLVGRRRRTLSNTTASLTPRRRRRRTRTTRVRVVRGRVALRIPGFNRLQHLGASQLVRFVPVNKLKAAAKRVLGKRPARGRSRRRRKGKLFKVRRGRRRRRRRQTQARAARVIRRRRRVRRL